VTESNVDRGGPDEAWTQICQTLRPHVSPEWSRYADEHGHQDWIRLILLVDAHSFLSQQRIAEKVAMTMSDLARDREGEREGWDSIAERAREERASQVAELVDTAERILPETLAPLFARSIEPARVQ